VSFRCEKNISLISALVMDQQTDAKISEMVNNAIQKYSLKPQNLIKMSLTL